MRGPQGSNVPLASPGACSRCDHQFPNLQEVRPEIAEYIVQAHLQACPESSDQERCQATQQLAASGMRGANAPFVASPFPLLQSTVAAKASSPARKRKKYQTDTMERKTALEADTMATDINETSVVCRGCRKTIKLDGRNAYYPGLWIKHRDKCKVIKSKQNGSVAPGEPRKKSTKKSAKQAMRMSSTTLIGRGTGNATARRGGGRTRRTSHASASPPYPQSPMRSVSSSNGSTAGPSTHGSFNEITYSVREETATPEWRGPDYGISPAMNSPSSRTQFDDRQLERYSRDDEPSTSRGGYTARSPTSMQEGREVGHVGSDQYWSEAPFGGGSEDSNAGLYRCSTRWELMHVFPGMQGRGYKYDDSDEETSPASP